MKINDFYRGMKIKWKDDSGVVNFIGSQYITITTREWPDPDKLLEYLNAIFFALVVIGMKLK